LQAEKREVMVPARQSDPTDPVYFHDRWIRSLEVPIYRGHFIEDLRTIELARWDERDCDVAFLQLEGQEFIQEVRIIEIAPGKTLPPYRIGLEEMVYVLKGRGQTTVWGVEGLPKKSFEWQERSIFMTPPGYYSQLSSLQGDQPARIMATSYLPLAFALRPDMDFFFKNPVVDLSLLYGEGQEPYSEAVAARNPSGHMLNLWVGNFFPDMKMWDKLEPYRHRGAGGTRVDFRSNFGRRGHMSVFPVGTYKRAHRHGPGRVIFIPDGEGYSIIWPQGGEKIVLPWHEASVFTPPISGSTSTSMLARSPHATSRSVRHGAPSRLTRRTTTIGKSTTWSRTRGSGISSRPSWRNVVWRLTCRRRRTSKAGTLEISGRRVAKWDTGSRWRLLYACHSANAMAQPVPASER